MTRKNDVTESLTGYLKTMNLTDSAIHRLVNEDLEYLLNWELSPDSSNELEEAQGIIAFSFGYGPVWDNLGDIEIQSYDPSIHQPGKSNEAFADLIVNLGKKKEHIFAQWEVAEALRTKHDIQLLDEHIARPGKSYLGTSGVIRQFLDHGLKNNYYEKIIIVAHRHHTYRCMKIVEKILLDEGFFGKKLVIPSNPDIYDPKSLQSWTTSLETWVAYEVGARFNNRFQKNMS